MTESGVENSTQSLSGHTPFTPKLLKLRLPFFVAILGASLWMPVLSLSSCIDEMLFDMLFAQVFPSKCFLACRYLKLDSLCYPFSLCSSSVGLVGILTNDQLVI